ncbi:TPA: AAA family ATPase [Photobacterium damselae]
MKYFYSEKFTFNNDGYFIVQDHLGSYHSAPWDDYGYTIKFKIYYRKNDEEKFLGYIRILAKDFDNTAKYFKEAGLEESDKVYDITEALKISSVVSLPLEMDYYSKLNSLLSRQEIELHLESICDASYFYSKYTLYKEWPGFTGSVMREGSTSEALLRKGHQIANGSYSPTNEFTITIDNASDSIGPVEFNFNNQREISKTNINLLIGKNGAGKTHILKSLSRLVTGIEENNQKWPYFHKLIIVAYSPFEDFYTKDEVLDRLDQRYSKNKKARKSKSKNRRRLNINEYSYIGFRTESSKFDLDWPKAHSVDSLFKILDYDEENNWWNENTRFENLKKVLTLSITFDKIAVRLKTDELTEINEENFKDIKDNVKKEDGIYFLIDNKIVELSSGQRIYSYMLPSIVAEIEDESLIVLDEPELYLHPSLEIGLINMLNYLLEETSSYAIIATHSAVIAREVEKNGISILTKNNNYSHSSKPTFETFGSSLELIMGEAFDDFNLIKPYQKNINKIIEQESNIESTLNKYGKDVGDEALAYILSSNKNDLEVEIEEE